MWWAEDEETWGHSEGFRKSRKADGSEQGSVGAAGRTNEVGSPCYAKGFFKILIEDPLNENKEQSDTVASLDFLYHHSRSGRSLWLNLYVNKAYSQDL